MRQLADRFKLMLMDPDAVRGACIIGLGAPFWRTQGGGIGAARDAQVVNLGKRHAGQVRALLRIEPGERPQRLDPDDLPPHLRRLLNESGAVCEAPAAALMRERSSAP